MSGRRLYAHRGASKLLPENTLPAFERALADGANALELDVHRTGDGAVVVSHDASGRRMCGAAQLFADASLAEVRSWDAASGFRDARGAAPFVGQGFVVPTFEEVLRAFPQVTLNVDLKDRDERLVKSAVELAAKYDARRVNFASFHGPNLALVRRLQHRGTTCLSPNAVRWLLVAPVTMTRAFRTRGEAVQVPPRAGRLRLDRRAFVEKAHQLGLRVDYWVVDDPAEAKRLLALGADGLVTNDPAALAPLFRAHEVA